MQCNGTSVSVLELKRGLHCVQLQGYKDNFIKLALIDFNA